MDLTDGLWNSLKDHSGWGKPRLACFVSLLPAVLRIQRKGADEWAPLFNGLCPGLCETERLSVMMRDTKLVLFEAMCKIS